MSNYFTIKHITILFILGLFNNCTDLLINNEHKYNSIKLNGGSWIEFQSTNVQEILSDGDFSFQIWATGDSESENIDAKALLCVFDDSNNNIHFAIYRDTSKNNEIVIYLNGVNKSIPIDNLDWSISEFIMLTITSNSTTGRIKIYTNKEEVTQLIVDPEDELNINADGILFDFDTGNSNLVIGARVDQGQVAPNNFWNGYIDEIRLWKKELTAEKITFHFENPEKLTPETSCSDSQYDTESTCTNGIDNTLVFTAEVLEVAEGCACADGTDASAGTDSGSCASVVCDDGADPVWTDAVAASDASCIDADGNALANWDGTEDDCTNAISNTLIWNSGTYSDFYFYDDEGNIDIILSGLWRFNYEDPQITIPDESCQELNLGNGASGEIQCTNIDGTIYTLPGDRVEFSNFGL